MLRNQGISLCIVVFLVACSNDSSGDDDTSGAADMQSVESSRAEVDDVEQDVAEGQAEGPFEMPVADVFNITGQGVVITGKVRSGAISVGDSVCISGGSPVTVTGIEIFRKLLDTLAAGDTGGLLLKDIAKGDVAKGDVVRSC